MVGMGFTEGAGSDSYPATVIEVSKSGKTIKVQSDLYQRADKAGPYTENQTYTYTANTNGAIRTYRLTKRGWTSHGSGGALGFRRAYFDPHF
jgi:hypothetical protein